MLVSRPPICLMVLLCGGCSLVTNFDAHHLIEDTSQLCADGVDNDGDGLTDCQDFKCAGQPACCTEPQIALEDHFQTLSCAAASCDAPTPGCLDESRWQAWGAPLPVLCEGALRPRKSETCYDIGVLGKAPLLLRQDLSITIGVQGRPEEAGHLDVGLTLESTVISGGQACSPFAELLPVAETLVEWAPSGYQLVAHYDQREIGRSSVITDDARHDLNMVVKADRRLHFLLDGSEYAVSPKEQLLPTPDLTGFLFLRGRSFSSRFADVVVTAGTQCEAPKGFTAVSRFLTLEAVPTTKWEAFQVYSPEVVRDSAGDVHLYYAGCENFSNDCDAEHREIGRATSIGGTAIFQRDPTNPIFQSEESTNLYRFDDLAVMNDGGTLRGFLSSGTTVAVGDQLDGADLLLKVFFDESERFAPPLHHAPLELGQPGAWDDESVCCATAVRRGDQIYLWYAGQSRRDPTPRIGLAVSSDGLTYQKLPAPVLGEGLLQDFDGRGVTEPMVVYDEARHLYRLWYKAQGFLGETSIGYAVSTDGINWHKYPQNPVITGGEYGLLDIGNPTVLVEEGRLRLWIDGRDATKDGRKRIYELENRGHPFE